MATRYRIQIGDEEIEFEGPDDLSEQQIEALGDSHLKTAKPGQTFAPTTYGGEVTPDGKPWEEMGYFERMKGIAQQYAREGAGLVQGAAESLDKAANLLEGGYNATLGNIFGQSDSADTPAFQNLAANLGEGDPTARTVGRFAGDAALTSRLGPIGQGAGVAALESDADNGWDFAKDVAIGGAAGKMGDVVAKGAAGVISPAVDASARMLHNAGVKLTPGQAIPALKEFEDKAMSWPFVGPKIIKGRQQSFEGFSRAPLDEALKAATGKPLPSSIKSGHQAIKHTGDRLSAEYEKLIPTLTFRGDQQLVQEVQDLGQRLAGAEFAPATRRRFDAMVRDGVMSRFKGTSATGREFQAADKYLGKQIERFGKSTDPEHQALADAFRDLQSSLSGALSRSNPQQAAKLENLNKGWSLLVPAESAGANAKGGIFSADQYRSAVRQNNKTVRKRGMARGEARGQELAEAGSEVLPSSFPNTSGTAGHEAYSLGNMRFYQGLAARGLYGDGVQNALTRVALSQRPAAAQPIAEGVKSLPAGSLGGFLSPYLSNALSPADR